MCAGGLGLWATWAASGVKSALPLFGAPEIDTGLEGTGDGPDRPVKSSFAGSLLSFEWGVLCCVILIPPAFTESFKYYLLGTKYSYMFMT